MALFVAATGLRISECLGLQWADVEFSKHQIFVRRKYVARRVGRPKSKASKSPVPMHPLLADFMLDWHQATPYSQPGDWIFASARMKGKQPRSASIMVEDYVRPAAVKVGILTTDAPCRFGFHNLRHSLASFLVSVAQTRKWFTGCSDTATFTRRFSFTARA
jgi:integrase